VLCLVPDGTTLRFVPYYEQRTLVIRKGEATAEPKTLLLLRFVISHEALAKWRPVCYLTFVLCLVPDGTTLRFVPYYEQRTLVIRGQGYR
ncbi:MAG: hypothetical protein RMK18_07950, partial [Armatimonadota bacterium]|nr:hypothetical protein [Armatimonadota bacterium]